MSVGNVVSLLGALREAGSPLTKAKLLALIVRGLRQLSSEERRELLTRLGVEKADRLADRLGEETDETTVEVVRELIRQADKAEPGKWRELAARLRDPEERRRLLAEGLELLDDLPSAEEATAAAAEPPAPPRDDSEAAAASALTPEPPRPVTYSWQEPKPRPSEPPESKSTAAEPGPKSAAAGPEAEPLSAVVPPPAKAPPRPAKSPIRGTAPPEKRARFAEPPTPRPPSSSARRRSVERRRGSRVGAPAAAPRPDKVRARTEAPSPGLWEQLGETASLVRRLRLLRERVAEAKSLGPGRLRSLVEMFSPGWPRRRALSTLLTAGIPADFDAALGLVVETMGSPTDRRWCLGSLAAGRDLTPHQQEALLAGLESPGWRRRLTRRLVANAAGRDAT